jgi:hypothetical protein
MKKSAMHLSPFAQYYIRKLLRQNVDRVSQSLSKDSLDSVLIKLDFNHVLSDLYQTKSELTTKIWELEALTQICQELEKNHYDQETPFQKPLLMRAKFMDSSSSLICLIGCKFISLLGHFRQKTFHYC